MRKLFGSLGKDVAIEQPFRCDCRTNISLGDSVFMNSNCLQLDVGEIRIGARTLLEPGMQIYTVNLSMEQRPLPKDQTENGACIECRQPATVGE